MRAMRHAQRCAVWSILSCLCPGLFPIGAADGAAATRDVPLPAFDFREAAAVAGWHKTHDVGEARATADGMEVVASGDDPYLVGPAVDLPEGAALALEMRVRSERGGAVEVFYFTDHAAAGKSVSARVAAGVWEDLRLPLPPLGNRITFRIDPPATAGGRATIASMVLRRRVVVKEPEWPQPPVAAVGHAPAATVRSGAISVSHSGAPGGIEVRVGGRLLAAGLSRSFIGYAHDGAARWVPLPDNATFTDNSPTLDEKTTTSDENGATWRVERRYSPSRTAGAIDVQTTLTVDRDRDLLFFPAFVLLPGAGSFGTAKAQALFPGLEYLGPDDASRSEADVIGPESQRRVPDSLKVTVPLMALCADGDYVALAWEPGPLVSAVFDSPDRTFGSGGHVMGLLLPGSNGRTRVAGSLLPEVPHRLKANQPVTVRATILAGAGRSVVPALKQYHALRGLPDVPNTGMDAQAYYRWAAGGWMDSKIREGSLVRHAVWPGFGVQPAADAAVWMHWLATQSQDASLRLRLTETANAVASAVPPARRNVAAVSHVRDPVASLVLGQTLENARAADEQARALLRRFESDGSVRFRREANKEDFARTNPTPTANGLTATHVARLLELAAVSGDSALIDSALALLRGLDRYEHDVPRGAQSWEVPLHTPDVLASAWLVRAYVTGFKLSGDRRLLELAEYWAWTGVPFVYLHNPTASPDHPTSRDSLSSEARRVLNRPPKRR